MNIKNVFYKQRGEIATAAMLIGIGIMAIGAVVVSRLANNQQAGNQDTRSLAALPVITDLSISVPVTNYARNGAKILVRAFKTADWTAQIVAAECLNTVLPSQYNQTLTGNCSLPTGGEQYTLWLQVFQPDGTSIAALDEITSPIVSGNQTSHTFPPIDFRDPAPVWTRVYVDVTNPVAAWQLKISSKGASDAAFTACFTKSIGSGFASGPPGVTRVDGICNNLRAESYLFQADVIAGDGTATGQTIQATQTMQGGPLAVNLVVMKLTLPSPVPVTVNVSNPNPAYRIKVIASQQSTTNQIICLDSPASAAQLSGKCDGLNPTLFYYINAQVYDPSGASLFSTTPWGHGPGGNNNASYTFSVGTCITSGGFCGPNVGGTCCGGTVCTQGSFQGQPVNLYTCVAPPTPTNTPVPPAPALTCSGITPSDASVSPNLTNYNYQAQVTGGTAPITYQWSVTTNGGTVMQAPTSGNVLWTWNPNPPIAFPAGTTSVTVKADLTDAASKTATCSVVVPVAGTGPAPTPVAQNDQWSISLNENLIIRYYDPQSPAPAPCSPIPAGYRVLYVHDNDTIQNDQVDRVDAAWQSLGANGEGIVSHSLCTPEIGYKHTGTSTSQSFSYTIFYKNGTQSTATVTLTVAGNPPVGTNTPTPTPTPTTGTTCTGVMHCTDGFSAYRASCGPTITPCSQSLKDPSGNAYECKAFKEQVFSDVAPQQLPAEICANAVAQAPPIGVAANMSALGQTRGLIQCSRVPSGACTTEQECAGRGDVIVNAASCPADPAATAPSICCVPFPVAESLSSASICKNKTDQGFYRDPSNNTCYKCNEGRFQANPNVTFSYGVPVDTSLCDPVLECQDILGLRQVNGKCYQCYGNKLGESYGQTLRACPADIQFFNQGETGNQRFSLLIQLNNLGQLTKKTFVDLFTFFTRTPGQLLDHWTF